jgi:hypothetical protein
MPSALKREHPALQNMKFLDFFSLLLWVIFALLDPVPDIPNADPDPDPLTWLNPDSPTASTLVIFEYKK